MHANPHPGAGDTNRQAQPDFEALPGGGTVEWVDERRIVIFTTPDSSRFTLQTLFDRTEQIVREWPADRPMLAILDLSSDKVGRTPYTRERGRALMHLRPDLRTCLSMLVGRSVQAQFLQLIIRTWQRGNQQMAIHFTREEATDWLRKVGGIR